MGKLSKIWTITKQEFQTWFLQAEFAVFLKFYIKKAILVFPSVSETLASPKFLIKSHYLFCYLMNLFNINSAHRSDIFYKSIISNFHVISFNNSSLLFDNSMHIWNFSGRWWHHIIMLPNLADFQNRSQTLIDSWISKPHNIILILRNCANT